MSDRAKSWFARWKMGQNLKNSYLPHREELRPHIWGGEPWPTYLQNDPKLERFRDFGTPNLGTPTPITSVNNKIVSQISKKSIPCQMESLFTASFQPSRRDFSGWREPGYPDYCGAAAAVSQLLTPKTLIRCQIRNLSFTLGTHSRIRANPVRW